MKLKYHSDRSSQFGTAGGRETRRRSSTSSSTPYEPSCYTPTRPGPTSKKSSGSAKRETTGSIPWRVPDAPIRLVRDQKRHHCPRKAGLREYQCIRGITDVSAFRDACIADVKKFKQSSDTPISQFHNFPTTL